MKNLKNSLLIRALNRQKVERTPIWMMRQAGRYLPEYRKTRQQAGDFLSLCKNPSLACEVTLQPLRRFEMDAAILFSDILTIPDAMGLGLHFIEGEGPRFSKPLVTGESIHKLSVPELEDLDYVFQAAQLIRQEMPGDLPLIGFSGSPWTLACYMVEGGSSKDFKKILQLIYQEPDLAHTLLQKLAASVTEYLVAQVNAGVNALMIFDTWGGILSTVNYSHFSLNYMHLIVQHLKTFCPHIPLILFTKNGGQWLEKMSATGCDALSLDWTCDLADARNRVGNKVALQGNLDPAVLLTSRGCVREQVASVLQAYGHGEGHIFNLGHGITPDVDPDMVKVMVEAVHEFSPAYHQ